MTALASLLALFASAAFLIYIVIWLVAYFLMGGVIYMLTMFFTAGRYGTKTNWVFVIWPAVVLYAVYAIIKAVPAEQNKQ